MEDESVSLPVPSLRDYFAAMAMQKIMWGITDEGELDESSKLYPKACYVIADAMLKERE